MSDLQNQDILDVPGTSSDPAHIDQFPPSINVRIFTE